MTIDLQNRQNLSSSSRIFASILQVRQAASRVIAEDLGHSKSEKRYFCFGEVNGGILTVRFTYRGGVIRIFGAGYWRKGKAIYERENK